LNHEIRTWLKRLSIPLFFTSLRPKIPIHRTLRPIAAKIRSFKGVGISIRLRSSTPTPSRKPVASLRLLLLCLKPKLCVVQSTIDGKAKRKESRKLT